MIYPPCVLYIICSEGITHEKNILCTFDWLSFKIKSSVCVCYTEFFIWFSQPRHFYKLDTCFILFKGSHKSLRSCVKMLMGKGGLIDCIQTEVYVYQYGTLSNCLCLLYRSFRGIK